MNPVEGSDDELVETLGEVERQIRAPLFQPLEVEQGDGHRLTDAAGLVVGHVAEPLAPEWVRIPAGFGVDQGTWFLVTDGIERIAVRDEPGGPVVSVVCEPAAQYDRLMTRCNWTRVFFNQVF